MFRLASVELIQYLTLDWSHYVMLLTISNGDVHSFYEIEVVENGRSMRKLQLCLPSNEELAAQLESIHRELKGPES